MNYLIKLLKKLIRLIKNSILRLKIKNTNKVTRFEIPKIEEIRRIIPNTMNISYKVE